MKKFAVALTLLMLSQPLNGFGAPSSWPTEQREEQQRFLKKQREYQEKIDRKQRERAYARKVERTFGISILAVCVGLLYTLKK